MVIFLSNFLALLIKADAAGEGSRSFLGGVMVMINVLLILAVVSASCLTAQQTVEDNLVANNAATFAGVIRTIEQRTAGTARSIREETAMPRSLFRSRGRSNDGVDSFDRGEGLTACVWPRSVHTARLGGTSDAAVPVPPLEPVVHSLSGEEHGRRFSFLPRAASSQAPRARATPVPRARVAPMMLVELNESHEQDSRCVSLSHPPPE